MLNKLKYPVLTFLVLSLGIHFMAWLGVNFVKVSTKSPMEKVEITFIETPKTDNIKKLDREKQQIVEQEKRINDEVPKDTKYLSKFDQVVKKETRAEKSGKFNNSARPGEQVQGQMQQPQPKKQVKLKPGPGKKPKLKDLTPQFSLTPDARKELVKHVGDPSQTDDYLKDVDKGIQTMLSTREFLYYSYYNRIKSKIRQYWEPGIRQKVQMIYRKGRSIASAKDRVTQVLITLDSRGDLLRIEVITQSGIRAIDDAAIEAFKAAAPFPNPPSGMVESDGRIRIRWDFILEASSLMNPEFGEIARR